jgi:hypothetical protein
MDQHGNMDLILFNIKIKLITLDVIKMYGYSWYNN